MRQEQNINFKLLSISEKSFSRPFAFAHRVVNNYYRPLGANSLSFLRSCFIEKFTVTEIHGLIGSMIYKKTGNLIHNSSYTWFVQANLSIGVSQVTQSLHFWVNSMPMARSLSSIGWSTFLHEHPTTQPGESSLLPTTAAHKEPKEALKTREKALHTLFSRTTAHEIKTVSTRTEDLFLSSFPMDLRGFMFYPGDLVPSPHDLPKQDAIPHLLPLRRPTLYRPETQPRQLTQEVGREGAGDRERLPAWLSFGQWFDPKERAKASKTRALESFSPLPGILRLNERREALSRGLPIGALPLAVRAGLKLGEDSRAYPSDEKFVPALGLPMRDLSDPFGPTLLQTGLEHLRERISIRNEPLVSGPDRKFVVSPAQAMGDGDEDPVEGVERDLTFLRKEELLQPPSLSYVFAQPMRPIVEEQQVIRRVEEKEVIEIVKKEVQTAISSGSAMMHLSRSDYLRIADQVYSVLVRRLMVERERLGLRS